MYLDSFKDIGIPLGKWEKESKFCSTRVYKRMIFNSISKSWVVELYLVCRTKNDAGEWEIHEPFVPMFTLIKPDMKRLQVRKLYQKGIPMETLRKIFGYNSTRMVQRITQDLRQRACKYNPK